jgi:hypothetical protein
MTRDTLKLLAQAVAIALALSATANAQSPIMPKMSLGGDNKRPLTPEEKAKQDALDRDYKAATNKIPDKIVNDPWATVRPAPPVPVTPAPAPKKKAAR